MLTPETRPSWPIFDTVLFTILVPGTVTVLVPYLILGGYGGLAHKPLMWLGAVVVGLGAAIYFRCAWEFAVRGLGTPAPIAPTKFLVTTALHRYVRNPMYIGVLLVVMGQALLFRAVALGIYAALLWLSFHLFVVLYEEPTLRHQFGESYQEYRRNVPRWLPKFRFSQRSIRNEHQ